MIDSAILVLRTEWAGLPAYVAVCDLAMDGTEPTAEEWAEIERTEAIGLYEGSKQDAARHWCEETLKLRERAEEQRDALVWP